MARNQNQNQPNSTAQTPKLEQQPASASAPVPNAPVTAAPSPLPPVIAPSPETPASELPIEEQQLSVEEQRRERIADLEAEHTELQAHLGEIHQRRYALQRAEKELTDRADEVLREIEQLSAPQSTTESIQTYLAGQQQLRIERAQRKQQLLEAGVDSSELRSMAAPIDQRLHQRRETDRPQIAKGA